MAQANQANAQAHYEDDSKANLKGRRTPVPRDSVTPDVKPVKSASNGSNHAGTGDNGQCVTSKSCCHMPCHVIFYHDLIMP